MTRFVRGTHEQDESVVCVRPHVVGDRLVEGVVMSKLLEKPWQLRFRAEMEAIGCKFGKTISIFGDEDIEVPLDKMDAARAIILKYSEQKERN